jgi:hypothetical protein
MTSPAKQLTAITNLINVLTKQLTAVNLTATQKEEMRNRISALQVEGNNIINRITN